MVAEPERTLRVDCYPFSPFFWTAVALNYDPKGVAAPKVSFVTGGPGFRALAFDVDPGPTEPIAQLIKASRAVEVRVRPTRTRQRLVRLGIIGRHDDKGTDREELAMVLELVAHSAPHLIWAGPGDRATPAADGCISERTVEFEMPFRRELEVFTATGSRPGSPGKSCPPAGPGIQESAPLRGVPLRPARPVGPAPAHP
jgi:hypothetical protein